MGGRSSKEIQDIFPVMLKAVCRDDPELRIFDSGLPSRTTRAIQSLASGVKIRSVSINSLGELLDTHPEEVRSILQSKKQSLKNKELLDLVEIYFESSFKTLDFFTSLKQCLNRARLSQSILQSASHQFDKSKSPSRYEETIQELKNFEAAGDPFSDEFKSLFESNCKEQISIWYKLVDKKGRLDARLKDVKVWKKVSYIILLATIAALLIFTVIAAAFKIWPLAADAVTPLGVMGRCLSSFWNKLDKELSTDLESIRADVNKIIIDMESLLKTANFGIKEEEGLKAAFDEMKKKSSGLLESIDKLDKRADRCRRCISWLTKVILKKIESEM